MIDKDVCDKGFIWNPNNCERECDKSYDVGEYLHYSNCKCKKKLAGKLVKECTKIIDKVEIASENEHKNKGSSCTPYILLFPIILTICIGIATYFLYSRWHLKNNDACVMLDTCTETTIY